ncbi:MAG: phage tail tape measure protein, partial [Gammaproteobacteria bacterium]|nr:phage tail tape measure protein [Gammaproteobacteria bacterium]
FRSLTDSIISDLARIAVKKSIVAPLAGAMMSGMGSMFGSLFNPTSSGISAGGISAQTPAFEGGGVPMFARGGRPSPNQMSIIGEKGPELFVPDTAGRVIPNNKLGQGSSGTGGNVNQSEVHININAMDTQTGVAFLLSQKDTIKGIFNSDLNTNGVIRANL